ncbi:MAG: hypothetical protein HRF50_17825 [Phycisphaerae bacterium]
MFERRLRWFIVLMVVLTGVIVARLVEIQVVRAADYQGLADRQLTRPIQYLRAPRGAIRDRNGALLISDVPTYDVNVHYAVLSGEDSRYLEALARELRRSDIAPKDRPLAESVAELRTRVAGMWRKLVELTGVPEDSLRARAASIVRRTQAMRDFIRSRSPNVPSIREEALLHPLIDNVDDRTAVGVRLALEGDPWLRVVPSSHRVARAPDALMHVLGRLGAASPEQIEADSLAADELRALARDDLCGVSGVERLAELTLRGTRGRVVEDFDRHTIEHTPPQPGRDVYLTIDAQIQSRVYELLAEAVENSEHPAGGAAVVLDAETREIIALVSYPAYSQEQLEREGDRLAADTRRTPLRCRAVSNAYPPGSTCKVITLYGGLAEGVVGEHARIHCTGHFLPNDQGKFRCWIYNQYPGVTHDMRGYPDGLDASDALRNSCNIYFYTVGDRLGLERLCRWFNALGLGRTQGTGLIEETDGIVPTAEWLAAARPGSPQPQAADVWNYSIGQGEVCATPLQAANVIASLAEGEWRPVCLARDGSGRRVGPPEAPAVPLDERHLRVLREGLWRVVNERGGTAYAAKLDMDDYELCGKTGSAQAVPLVLNRRYFFEWPGGRRETVLATSEEEAALRFADVSPPPRLVGWRAQDRFPAWQEGDKLPAHAWFTGYTQPARTPRGARPRGSVYAISVIIEFGGSGGNVAGPVAKRIAELLLQAEPEWG